MATPKRWSRTLGTRRGNRIRVYEREPGGKLYAAVWDPERHKYTQTGLGHHTSTPRPASATTTASALYVM